MTPAFSQIYSRVGDYHEGLALVQGYTKVNGYSKKYGYVNEYNKLVIPLKYEYAESFGNGRAVVGMGVKRGVINKKQVVVVPLIYDEIIHYHSYHNKDGYISGETSYFIVRKGSEWGVLNHSGKVLISLKDRGRIPKGDYLGFSEVIGGFRFLARLFDSNGRELLPDGCYVSNWAYDEWRSGLWRTDCGNYNMNTKTLETELTYGKTFSDGLVKVIDKSGHCGLMKYTTGEIVLPLVYDDILEIMNGMIKVVRGGDTIYMERNGGNEYKVKQEGWRVLVVTNGGKDGLVVEHSLEFIVDCIYDEIIELIPGVFRLSKDGKKGLMDLREYIYNYINYHSFQHADWLVSLSSPDLKSHIGFCAPLVYDYIKAVEIRNLDNALNYAFCCRKSGKWELYKFDNYGSLTLITESVFDNIPQEINVGNDNYWISDM